MKKVLLIVLILLLVGVVTGYYIWNKPHDTVESHKATPVSVTEITNAFATDEKAANGQYLNKVLSISGNASEVTKNQDGKTVVFFSEDGITGVQGTLRDGNAEVKAGENITIQGFCNGYTGIVLLSDCILKK